MPSRFSQVSEDVYRGGVPTSEELQILSNLYGVKRVISLDGPIGSEISPTCYKLNMDHIIIPISDKSSEGMIKFLKENIEELFSIKPLYIHCRHGRDRTGLAVALYRIIEEGWSKDDALKEALSFEFGDGLDPETQELYESFITDNKSDSNDLQDYGHNNFNSAHDVLMPTSYQKHTNSLGDDIVSDMRTQFNFGDVPPAFNPQQSWSVKDDIKYEPPVRGLEETPLEYKDPFYFMSSQEYWSEAREKRKKRKELLQELAFNNAFQVGGYDNYDGIRGAGPFAGSEETGGFLQDTERPSGALGVAPTTTGGFLNL